MSNGLKVNLGKTKVMFSSGITQDGMSKIKLIYAEFAAWE